MKIKYKAERAAKGKGKHSVGRRGPTPLRFPKTRGGIRR